MTTSTASTSSVTTEEIGPCTVRVWRGPWFQASTGSMTDSIVPSSKVSRRKIGSCIVLSFGSDTRIKRPPRRSDA